MSGLSESEDVTSGMRIVNMTDNNTDSGLDLTPVKFEVHQEYDYEKILFGLFFICLALR